MQALSLLRCNYHGNREAAAMCARCHKPYCRECVTEHEGRVLCTGCLALPAARAARRFRPGLVLLSSCTLLASLLGLVLLFTLLGKTLLNLPSEAYPETVWPGEDAK